MHKVYAELVFLDNFAVNLLIILLAAQLTQTRRRWGRYALAAGLGGVYASVAFGVPSATMLPIRVAVGVMMGLIAFWARGERGRVARRLRILGGVVCAGRRGLCRGDSVWGDGGSGRRDHRPPAPARAIILGLLTGAVAVGLLGISRGACAGRRSSPQISG